MRILEDFFDDIEDSEIKDSKEVITKDLKDDDNAIYISFSLDDAMGKITSGEASVMLKKKIESVLSRCRNVIEFSEPEIEKDSGRFYQYGLSVYITHKMRTIEEVMRLLKAMSKSIEKYRRNFVYIRKKGYGETKLYSVNIYHWILEGKILEPEDRETFFHELLILENVFLPGKTDSVAWIVDRMGGREEVYKKIKKKYMQSARELKLSDSTIEKLCDGRLEIPLKDNLSSFVAHIHVDEIFADDTKVVTELRRIFPMYQVIAEKYKDAKVNDVRILRTTNKDDINLYALIWVGVDYVFKKEIPDCIVLCLRHGVWGGMNGYRSQIRDFFDELNNDLGGQLDENVYKDILKSLEKQKISKENMTVGEYFSV